MVNPGLELTSKITYSGFSTVISGQRISNPAIANPGKQDKVFKANALKNKENTTVIDCMIKILSQMNKTPTSIRYDNGSWIHIYIF